ncbi:MAG: TIM barrel protein [Rhodospirillales bacterium]
MPVFCAHLGYLFTELPLEERFSAAAAAGFTTVEHPAPYDFSIARFRDLLDAHDLTCAQIAAPAGDPGKGEKGLACLKDRTAGFRESVDTGIAAAREIGTSLLHIMPGILPDGATREDCRETYLTNLGWAADRCAAANITVLIEAISDESVAGFYVNHPDFALDLISGLSHGHVAMLFDVYHAAVKGLDPVAFIEQHLDRIAHIQIADYPGRHEPGTGTLPYKEIFARLDSLAYPGVVGCEYKPAHDTIGSLSWLAEVNKDSPARGRR